MQKQYDDSLEGRLKSYINERIMDSNIESVFFFMAIILMLVLMSFGIYTNFSSLEKKLDKIQKTQQTQSKTLDQIGEFQCDCSMYEAEEMPHGW